MNQNLKMALILWGAVALMTLGYVLGRMEA
jgi:hypothetical protein